MALTLLVAVALLSGSATALRHKVEGACACKSWKQTYASGDAKCGGAAEFLGICANFFEALDDNVCVNLNSDDEAAGQWCYVDAACSVLNGGASVNKKVSWKQCVDGEDKMLRNYPPTEIKDIAQNHRMPIGLTLKMSYVHPKDIWDFFPPEAVQAMRTLVSDNKQQKAKEVRGPKTFKDGQQVMVKTAVELDKDIRDGILDKAARPSGYTFSDEVIQTAVKYYDEAAPPAVMDIADDRGDPVVIFYKKSLFLALDADDHVFMVRVPLMGK